MAKMSNIIKIHGSMSEILATLKTLENIIGERATLSDVVDLVTYSSIKKLINKRMIKEHD